MIEPFAHCSRCDMWSPVSEDGRCEQHTAEEWMSLAERLLGKLLAAIHGDGGHYQMEHGVEKAVRDAIAKYYRLVEQLDRLTSTQEKD